MLGFFIFAFLNWVLAMVALARKKKKSVVTKFIAIDTEATGLFGAHGCRAFAISTCDQDGNTNYFEAPVDPLTREPKWDTKVLRKAWKLISSFKVHVYHNMNFDNWMLSLLPLQEFQKLPRFYTEGTFEYHDTIVRAHNIKSDDPLGLKDQALLYCDILDDDEHILDDCVKSLRRKNELKDLGWQLASEGVPQLAGQKDSFHKCDFWLPKAYADYYKLPANHEYHHVCSKYAIKDAIRTAALFIRQEVTFQEADYLQRPYEIQRNLTPAISRMSRNGLTLNKKNFTKSLSEADQDRQKALRTMQELLEDESFNPNSGPQLKQVLYNHFGFKTDRTTKTGNPSTDKHALPELKNQKASKTAHKFLDALLDYRAVNSAVTYLQSYSRFQLDWTLYPSVHQCGTNTTRMAMQSPNGQNIGKGKEVLDENGNPVIVYSIRKVFGPLDKEIWSSIDYDQLQLRIFAYWSKDPKLIQAFESGFDFHNYMAMQIFETDQPTKLQRRIAKNVNFGYIFGAGESKIDATCGMPGIFRRVQSLFPCVTESIARTISFVKRHGYVETASGYRLRVPKHKAYAGVNYIVQGTEGDIVKLALTNCDRYLLDNFVKTESVKDNPTTSKAKLILQVHDELLFALAKVLGYSKINKTLLDLARIMEQAGHTFGVPCICKPEVIVNNWADAIKLDDWKLQPV